MKEKLDSTMFYDNLRNEIISENRFQRKKALENLIREVNDEKNKSECQKLFNEYQVYILKCFRDESEMCRELAMELMLCIIKNLSINDYYLTYIFPVLVERIGSPELVEESEELRLKMVQFMTEIISMYSKTEYITPFLNDIIEVLVNSLNDKHPKVKHSCCECVLATAEAMPKHFHMQCENLIKPLLKCFTHQHFRLRVIAIQAIGVVIMHGSYKALESTVTNLAERLFDQIPQVRRAVIQVSADLLMEYRDRYSYFHKILPLILTGLSDEVPDTRNFAEGLWEKVGMKYQNENEKDMKDELDFIEIIPVKSKYPRPNIGCRTLVNRHSTKIVAALCRELSTTWLDDVKLRCGQLLTSIILHCEANFTMNLQDVFPAMFSVCRQNDDGSQSVIKASVLIGVFISPKTWFKFISEIFSSNVTTGHLRVLKAILTGCDQANLTSIADEVSAVLSGRHICHVRNIVYQKELIDCCVILENCDDCKVDLSIVSLAVLALGDEQDGRWTNTKEKAEKIVENSWIQNENPVEICKNILDSLTGDPTSWVYVTSDRCVLDAVLTRSVSVANLEKSSLLDVLTQTLCQGQDPEAKLTTFIALSKALETWNQSKCNQMEDFYGKITKDIILPNLIWHAGRSQEALRTISMQCLNTILESGPFTWVLEVTPRIVPLLVSLLEDSSKHTRAFSVSAVSRLTMPDQESLIRVYQLLLSRLDDEFEVARVGAVAALRNVFERLPRDFDKKVFEPHFEHLVDTLLVHLDDDDDELKKELMDALKVVSPINSSYVINKISTMDHLFEDKKDYDEFIDNIS